VTDFRRGTPTLTKRILSPWQIIERLAPRSPLELYLLPPVFLDYYLNDSGGYSLAKSMKFKPRPGCGVFKTEVNYAVGPQ
jgi:hypothetical protein